MNTLLKKMMLALLALGIGQAVWADDVPNLKEIIDLLRKYSSHRINQSCNQIYP